jgi:hypothetical protein
MQWEQFASLLLQLSREALRWYRMIDGDNGGVEKAQKVVAVVLDPDTPEQSPEEVDLG